MRPSSARVLATLVAVASLLGGCGSKDEVPAYSAEEKKLVDQMKAETPQQQIERIQKGPMPPAAKEAMIKRIKDENGIK